MNEKKPDGKAFEMVSAVKTMMRYLERITAELETGDITEDDAQANIAGIFDVTAERLAENVDAIVPAVRYVEAQAKLYREMAKAYTAKAKTCDNVVDRCKLSAANAMAILNTKEIAGQLHRIKMQKNPARLEINTTDFMTSKTDVARYVNYAPEIDKAAIRDALKAGATVVGCAMVQSESVRLS